MKITVIGAGTIGAAVAYYLGQQEDVEQLQVCDSGARSLQYLHERIRSPKLRSFQIDARDPSVLEPIVEGSACVVSCVPPEINPVLAKLCVQLGCHFCDLGGNDAIVQQELALAEQAREKSIWIVPNCGLSPGLCNILCMYGIEQFDEVEDAYIRAGNIPLHPEPPFNFRISWSAEKILDDYTIPAQMICDRKIEEIIPLTENERIQFGEPFGTLEAFYTSGGLTTLVHELDGRMRTLDYKTIRWPGHADQMRFVLGLGFADKQTIDVRTHLTYRDLLIRRMRQRLGGQYEDAVLLRILIHGKKDGQPCSLLYQMTDYFDAEAQLSAMMRCTSIPTAVAAYMIASGHVPGGGAAPPEHVVPKSEFFEILAGRGLHIESQWFDGYRSVTDPSADASR